MISLSVAVRLLTDDPMLEFAVHHLLGAELAGSEVRRFSTFLQLADDLQEASGGLVLADLTSSIPTHDVESFRRSFPEVQLLCRCDDSFLAEELRSSCNGVISHRASGQELRDAMMALLGRTMGQTRARAVQIRLTFRESQLMTLLSQGYKNKEIAACLGITTGTVKVYLSTLFKKTGARDRFELTLFGIKNSLFGAADVSQPIPVAMAEKRALSRPVLTSMRLLQLSNAG